MLVLRRAGAADLDFLVHADLQEEGYTRSEDEERESAAEHREKICSFLRDANKAAWVYEDKGIRGAAILCAFRDLHNEPKEAHGLHFYRSAIPRATFPEDGRFCEVFNLWVERPYRRRGLATKLKEQLEGRIACARRAPSLHAHRRNQPTRARAQRENGIPRDSAWTNLGRGRARESG